MPEDELSPTEMLYMTYEGNWLLECESTVLAVTQVEQPGQVSIVLDRTVLHAQGGGQPTDTGRLVLLPEKETSREAEIKISKVLLDRSTGVAQHTGTVQTYDNQESIQVGDVVKVLVDQDNRRILSECHSAGHVVDSAMARCGQSLKPGKAYHFLEGPYVEYGGTIAEADREALLSDLQSAFCQLVQEDIATGIALLSPDEADNVCNRLAQNFDMNVFCDARTNTVRVVTVAGFPCPCGGTHVRSTGELAHNQWGITALKCKKGVVRVSSTVKELQ